MAWRACFACSRLWRTAGSTVCYTHVRLTACTLFAGRQDGHASANRETAASRQRRAQRRLAGLCGSAGACTPGSWQINCLKPECLFRPHVATP